MSDPTDPRTSTVTWSRAHVTLVIIAVLVVFAVAGSVFFLMSGAVPDSSQTVLEEPAPAVGGPPAGRL